METNELIALVAEVRAGRSEDELLDWKRAFWDLKRTEGRREFLKDIAAAANSLGTEGVRRIIVGLTGNGTIHEADLPMDEATLQQYLLAITPVPNVNFELHHVEGNKMIVLEIKPPFNRPYVTKLGSEHFVWVRQGSSTGTASRYHFDEFYGKKLATPELALHWLDENANVVEILQVPGIPELNRDEEIEALLARRPTIEDLSVLENMSDKLIKLLKQVGPEQLGLGRLETKPETLVKLPLGLAKTIDSIIELARRSPDEFSWRYSLQTRAVAPTVRILNSGTKPASNIVIYLDSSEDIKLLGSDELFDLNLSAGSKVHARAMKIIDLAKNPPRPRIEIVASASNYYRSLDMMRNINMPPVLKAVDVSARGGRARIDVNGQLKHNFSRTAEMRNTVFIAARLRSGLEGLINYECHADEQQQPSRGSLRVRAI